MTHATWCAEFELWLDAGAEPNDARALLAHAGSCARCGSALVAIRAIDTWFEVSGSAPIGFTDAVMARVTDVAATRATASPLWAAPMATDLPWWVDVLQQPSVVLAALASALLLWRLDALLVLVASASSWLTAAAPAMSAHAIDSVGALFRGSPAGATASVVVSPGTAWLIVAGLAFGLAPLAAVASIGVVGRVARVVTRLARLA